MKRERLVLTLISALSAVLMSIPWLVPHTGALALIGFVPLLCADAIADQCRVGKFRICHYTTFVLWNAFTTFWVCNATVGGGIFAVLANALQMSFIWGLFRLSKRKLSGVVPYIFLAAMWIAWERAYFDAQISWPWLVLGNAFARSTRLVQWYEYTGTLGGSLWIWAANLVVFGIVTALSDGRWRRWNITARCSAALAALIVLVGPPVLSKCIWNGYEERSEGEVNVLVGQPNFDPYEKFQSMSQAQQTAVLLGQFDSVLTASPLKDEPVLLMAPETFTGDIVLNHTETSRTLTSIEEFLQKYPGAEMLFGASTYQIYDTRTAPSILARPYGEGWIESHNSALLASSDKPLQLFHKSKLVVGVESTPYPKVFVPLDTWLSKKMGESSLMGRCVGQKEISTLECQDGIELGCAVCYESVYPEYCTGYANKGAKFLAVITNDAWWGDTPGYRQHFSYSRLRAIELRRDVARCGNTGISGFIDQKGEVVSSTPWWTRTTISGAVNLNSELTYFAAHGDITGRVCTLVFLLLLALLFVRLFIPER